MNEIVSKINNLINEFLNGNKKIAYTKLKKISLKYPNNEKLKFNLAFMEQSQGFKEKAKKSYFYLIKNYNNFNSKLNLYNILLKEKNYIDSIKLIENILNINNNLTDVWLDKAYIYLKLKNYEESKKICLKILEKLKNNLKAFNLIGLCYLEEKEFLLSKEYFLKGLLIDNKNIPLLNSLAKLNYEEWKLDEAEKNYLKAYKINPKSYQTINNLAGFYLETNNSIKAKEYFLIALKHKPNEPTILNNLSKAYMSLDNLELAKQFSKKSLKINNSDSTKKTLSLIYLKEQNFQKAWEFFDGRLGLKDFVQKNESYNLIKKKLLNKKKINPDKKLLIIREQGVGDELLYGTMYKSVIETFDNVIIEMDERLISLFVNSFGNKYSNNFVKLGYYSHDKNKLKKIDQILYAGSLGYYFRRDIKDFPKKNYLNINENIVRQTKKQLQSYSKKFKVGVSWKSFNNMYSNQKSLSLEKLINLFEIENIDFFNLQYGNVMEELKQFKKNQNIKIITLKHIDLFNDFVLIGSLLKNLDLFITVSNSTAHLAGSLGIKTLLIKPFNQASFHYWNQSSNNTPWYSSIEIIESKLLKNKKLLKEKIYSKLI